jgi:choice-of-anchor C domain-containing protein
VNGSFEEGPETGPFVPLEEKDAQIKGWTVINAQIDYIGGYWQAAEGKRSLDLHGSPGLGGVKQEFETKKGTKYKVTLSIAINPDGEGKKKKVTVAAAGKSETFTAEPKDATKEDMKWEKKTWEFTATDTKTTLEISTGETTEESCGPALDDVVVVEVKK